MEHNTAKLGFYKYIFLFNFTPIRETDCRKNNPNIFTADEYCKEANPCYIKNNYSIFK